MPSKKKTTINNTKTPPPPLLEISSETISTTIQKIPNKPIFRTAKFSSISTIKEVRIKQWKIKSFHFGKTPSPIYDVRLTREIYSTLQQIIRDLSRPSLKKNFKYLKHLDISQQYQISISHLKRFFPELSKVEKLAFSLDPKSYLAKKFLKNFINPQIKHLVLHLGFSYQGDQFLKTSLIRLKKCEHKFVINNGNFISTIIGGVKSPINFLPVSQLCPFPRMILSLSDSLQDLRLNYSSPNFSILRELKFPQLKKLRFELHTTEHLRDFDLVFLENSPNIEILDLHLVNSQIQSFDFAASFSKLREFSFSSISWTTTHPKIPLFPAFQNLDRLQIHIEFGIVDLQNLQKLIFLNHNKIKSFSILLAMEKITKVFSEDMTFPALQQLSFSIVGLDPNNSNQIKALQKPLLIFKQVEKVSLQAEALYVSIFHPLMKSLEQFSNLQSLNLSTRRSGELEDKKFAKIKDLFKSHSNLKSLELNLQNDLMNSRELSSLVDAFTLLQDLEFLDLKLSLVKISSNTFDKFADSFKSRRKLKQLSIKTKGLNEEETERIKQISFEPKFWTDEMNIKPLI